MSLLKAATPGQAWGRQELLGVVFWLRQLLALLAGVAAGIGALPGIPGLLFFAAVAVVGCHLFCTRYQRVDVDALFGGPADLAKEGLGPALSLYLVGASVILA